MDEVDFSWGWLEFGFEKLIGFLFIVLFKLVLSGMWRYGRTCHAI